MELLDVLDVELVELLLSTDELELSLLEEVLDVELLLVLEVLEVLLLLRTDDELDSELLLVLEDELVLEVELLLSTELEELELELDDEVLLVLEEEPAAAASPYKYISFSFMCWLFDPLTLSAVILMLSELSPCPDTSLESTSLSTSLASAVIEQAGANEVYPPSSYSISNSVASAVAQRPPGTIVKLQRVYVASKSMSI